MDANTKTHSQKLQENSGTTSRNKAILALFEAGMRKAEIARQFIVRGHPMSRSQVGEILKMMQKERGNYGNDASLSK